MLNSQRYEAIDYLAIGHITVDLADGTPRLGGSATYAALTAQAMGLRAGIVTAWGEELPADALEDIQIVNTPVEHSTNFENIYLVDGRQQRLHHLASPLEFHMIPQAWRETPIVHLAPVIGEVSPRILSYFPEATRAVTPQGWLREWDAGGQVRAGAWPEGAHVLRQSDAAVISVEDVEGDEALIEQMAASCPVLAITHGAGGARLFLNGESHNLDAEETEQIDPTGAGDIFAAAFFVRLHYGRDALAAAQFANQVAARSVERRGLEGVPTRDEIYDLLPEAV